MKRLARIVSLSIVVVGAFYTLAVPRLDAAPVAPSLSVAVNPENLVPGQAGYAFVGGGYPLQVEMKLDGKPLDVFWTGSGYEGLYAFGLDEPSGSHTLTIHVVEPFGGEPVDRTATLKVDSFDYPRESVAIPYRLQPLLDPTLNRNELETLEKTYSVHTYPNGFDWPFALPVPGGIVTSRYGGNRSYNGGVLTARHTGMDFRRSIGEPVQATADGYVVLAEYLNIRGNVVILDHGHGVFSQYAHLSQIQVQPGQLVHRGQILGLAGNTGRANGPHLHFEVIVNGFPVDPLKWLALAPGFVAPREATPIPSQPQPTGS
jgi:murein DD-endopeptidase MepM/ murein hydrolase activator NlpD